MLRAPIRAFHQKPRQKKKEKERTLCSLSPTTHEAGGWEEAAPSLDDVWCGAGDWDLGFK